MCLSGKRLPSFLVACFFCYFWVGQKLSHNLGIIRALASEAPIGMAGYPNWIRRNRIETNRIKNKNRTWNLRCDMRIMFVIFPGSLAFTWKQKHCPNIVKLFSWADQPCRNPWHPRNPDIHGKMPILLLDILDILYFYILEQARPRWHHNLWGWLTH